MCLVPSKILIDMVNLKDRVRWAPRTCLPSSKRQIHVHEFVPDYLSPNNFHWIYMEWTFQVILILILFGIGIERIMPLSLYRLWSSNLWYRNYFSPLCLCRLLQIIGHSNFNLFCIMSPIPQQTRTATIIIYFDVIFKVNTQILYKRRVDTRLFDIVYTYVIRICASTFCNNKIYEFFERDRD